MKINVKVKQLMVIAAVIGCISSYALTTQEIVNQSKASVVAIVYTNSTNGETWTGTGWFVTENRIVTNSHVAAVPDRADKVQITNIATGQEYTVDHLAYNNTATDAAVIVTKESNRSHLNLSLIAAFDGQTIVFIGNPRNEFGKVWEGKAGETFEFGYGKFNNCLMIDAVIEGGSSGSPVLNYSGEVVAMIWGSSKTGSSGVAVPLKTLQLAQLDSIDLYASSNPPAVPTPTPKAYVENEGNGLVVPKHFGKTRISTSTKYTLTDIVDDDARSAIAYPLVAYLEHPGKATMGTQGVFMQHLGWFFDLKDVNAEEAFKKDDAYAIKWPYQSNKIHYESVTVEKVDWEGKLYYLVCIPIDWEVGNKAKGKKQSGSSVVKAYIQPGVHSGTEKPDYFIASIWSVK